MKQKHICLWDCSVIWGCLHTLCFCAGALLCWWLVTHHLLWRLWWVTYKHLSHSGDKMKNVFGFFVLSSNLWLMFKVECNSRLNPTKTTLLKVRGCEMRTIQHKSYFSGGTKWLTHNTVDVLSDGWLRRLASGCAGGFLYYIYIIIIIFVRCTLIIEQFSCLNGLMMLTHYLFTAGETCWGLQVLCSGHGLQ